MPLSIDERQRRELWGLALLALSLLTALSLLPPDLLGSSAARLFPTGNVVGVVGAALAGGLWALFGAAAFLIPLLPGLGAAVAFGWVASERALRWSALLAGVMLALPALLRLLVPGPAPFAAAGWLGGTIGDGLATGFGAAGGVLLIGFLFAALCVVTTGWNPLRSLAGGGRAAWLGARRAAAGVPEMIARPARTEPAGEWVDPEEEDEDESSPAAEELPPVGGAPGAAEFDPEVTQPFPVPPPSMTGGRARERSREPRAAPAAAEVLPPDSGDPDSPDLPSVELLAAPPLRDEARSRKELDALGQVVVDKLATFKIAGEVVGMTVGPTVTQFEIAPAPGVKVARIANLEADLALALRAPSVRIVAPIPGKGAVGVEVPNPAPEMVFFRETIESREFRGSKAQLPLALGKDIAGRPHVADLARMPHLLIAGATGSGKSVCVNTIITSLIYRHSPKTLRFLMVDPKMVELSMYNDLPHLRHPVVTDNNEAAAVLKWAVIEMERRYQLLSANGVRNLQDFNRRVESGGILRAVEPSGEEGDPDRWIYRAGALPYVVLIIDELADLMMTVQGDVEKPLALLAQKARAIGIHLILATQRPSVNVITGLIKANFPSRIAFRVSSKIDSRTILDQNGADALLGNGDMLMLPLGSGEPIRMQGAYLSTEDTEALMGWYRERAELRKAAALAEGTHPDSEREEDILEAVRALEEIGIRNDDEDDGAPEDRDKLFREAAELCIQHQGGSTSLLQRRLRIGYGRAARVVDQLHMAGVLGPPDGSKPRDVLIDMMGLDQICPD
jgi:S-DNA-T family DNA segregation ATPase FtsK/SpoIIIE